MDKPHILILAGTTEARALAERLAGRSDLDVTLSLAGRTAEPRPLPVRTRVGGFGGVDGLVSYIENERIDLLIDATHPFANQISANAAATSARSGVRHFILCRPGWSRLEGDRWTITGSVEEAVDALGVAPRRVFLAIGRQEAARFSAAPQHSYLVRSVDPVDPPLTVPDCRYILACGPFDPADEEALLSRERIDVVVTKDSGGSATYGKIAAARALGLEVIMIGRQPPPGVQTVADAEAALALIDHAFPPSWKRGV